MGGEWVTTELKIEGLRLIYMPNEFYIKFTILVYKSNDKIHFYKH